MAVDTHTTVPNLVFAQVDTKLKLRTGDVEFWRGELDNKLGQLKEEISNMTNLKIRVDSEAKSCTEPINIAQQCVTFRGGRQGCDLIRDDVDVSLDRELDHLKMSQVCLISLPPIHLTFIYLLNAYLA